MTPATKGEKSFHLKNDLSELERLRQAVAEFGERHNLPKDVIFNVNLALDEILTNVICHGYGDSEEHDISVRLFLEQEKLTVEVEDDARPFNPLEASEPDVDQSLEERPIGGLGIYLVRQMMDELEYRRGNDKNHLILAARFRET